MCCRQTRELITNNIIEPGTAVLFKYKKSVTANLRGCITGNIYVFKKDKIIAVHSNDRDCLKKFWFLEEVQK